MSTNFRRIQPISLFNTTWQSRDLEGLKDKPGVGDVKREVALPPSNFNTFFSGRGRSVEVDRDIWGADWSPVPDEDWETLPDAIYDFETAYLQFQMSVSAGIPGDTILFAYNAPAHDLDDEVHLYTQLQIPSFGSGSDSVNPGQVRTTSRHLVEGFAPVREHDDPAATMKSDTLVSLYGVGRTGDIEISVECLLVGGFDAE
jgi:hypothetical protein